MRTATTDSQNRGIARRLRSLYTKLNLRFDLRSVCEICVRCTNNSKLLKRYLLTHIVQCFCSVSLWSFRLSLLVGIVNISPLIIGCLLMQTRWRYGILFYAKKVMVWRRHPVCLQICSLRCRVIPDSVFSHFFSPRFICRYLVPDTHQERKYVEAQAQQGKQLKWRCRSREDVQTFISSSTSCSLAVYFSANRFSAKRFRLSRSRRRTFCIKSRTFVRLLAMLDSPLRTRLSTVGTVTTNGSFAWSKQLETRRNARFLGNIASLFAPMPGSKAGTRPGAKALSVE